MVRRSLGIALFIFLVLGLAATPAALAYGPYASYPVDANTRLVERAGPAVVVWADGDSIHAQRFSEAGAGPVRTLASSLIGLSAWYADSDGTRVTVVWKAGSAVSATCVDLADGSVKYTPVTVTVTTDAQAVQLIGAGATVTPAGVAADGQGGAYVWCALAPTSTTQGVGDTLLDHISATGALASGDPAEQVVAGGTIAGMAPVGGGDALALLQAPGRAQVAARRYGTDLIPEWTRSPYLFPPSSVHSSDALAVLGGSDAAIAWREGDKVKVQRFTETGTVKFLSPPAVTMAGDAEVAADGSGGFYMVGTSGWELVARHILASGLEASWDPSTFAVGHAGAYLDAVTTNNAGDLFAAFSDPLNPGIALLTYTGAWSTMYPSPRPERWQGASPDGTGGAYVLSNGYGAALWHITATTPYLTFRPRAKVVAYGKSVAVAGYDTRAGGTPESGAEVRIHPVSGSGAAVTAVTDETGYYRGTLRPLANATWTATADGVAAGPVTIHVAPKVTLALSHLKAGTRLSEIFSGSVAPNHRGKKVLVQKAVGSTWKTVASGKLDSRSRYHITWYLPYRTATYKLRTIVPAHADHVQGTSTTATLRVVIRKS